MSASTEREGPSLTRTVVRRPFRRHGLHSSFQPNSRLGSSSRRSFSLEGGSKVLQKSIIQSPKAAVRVLDEECNDVTPLPLCQANPGAAQATASILFKDGISADSASDQTTATESFSVPLSRSFLDSSRISSQSSLWFMNEEMEETSSKWNVSNSFPDDRSKTEALREEVELTLKETKDLFLTETDNISLLDIPSTFLLLDADHPEASKKTRRKDQYVDRSSQTFHGAPKNKHVQSDGLLLVDAGVAVSTSIMYDDAELEERPDKPEAVNYAGASVDSDDRGSLVSPVRSAERSTSAGSMATAVSVSSSLKDAEVSENTPKSDVELIGLSKKFLHSLLVVEKTILQSLLQPQLAVYRQLPSLKDYIVEVDREEQRDAEISENPALEGLWVFSCELTRGFSVSSMAWNKKNLDLLAVGYGEFDSTDQRPGLVCCWSLKNPMWPERVVHCDSAVTSLDFSAARPSHLAVGTFDGSIAIYDIQNPDSTSLFLDTSKCPSRHLGPVWQLRWNQQELGLPAEERLEDLISVGADGRIIKWFVCTGSLGHTELMKLKRTSYKTPDAKNTGGVSQSVLSSLIPALCLDFHPTEPGIYLTGTWEGLIHKCSCSNNQQYLDTYRKHYCAVNYVAWCPLSRDVFLSCSADCTIQLWTQNQHNPMLSFSTTRKVVHDIKWSSKWATVFAAVYDEQLEIWDLDLSCLNPVIVQPAPPGVRLASLLFASHTDCVVVGDSCGQVTVYHLRNLGVGGSNQVLRRSR
ncbi:WD repeat-containing protein 78 isoform X2 [Oryzias melastigma]|uniref:WD repeat-containing protein 78 isoform X2 n=1 Tax=Oryzias melastigma TaxID=30732 RepID=UPI000CF7D9B2|nr:WD repeat-containing protein 78 isoform X2 [Oryzias melastigma]